MQASYPVTWREGDGSARSGKLELGPTALSFAGSSAGGVPAHRELRYDELAGVRIGRSESERIDGRPSLILERRAGPSIRVASVIQQGVVYELAQRLASLLLGEPGALGRILVIVPRREG